MSRRRDQPPAFSEDEAPFHEASRGERIQRVLADAGIASRRACETLVEEGRVEVNGVLITALPAWINPASDRVEVDGRPLAVAPEKHVYIMFNKPVRTVTTVLDEPGAARRTVLEFIDHPSRARLFPVGRLDFETTGLLLMTNDGDLAHKLTHPRFGVEKTYRVTVAGALNEDEVEELERGIFLADRKSGRTTGGVKAGHVRLALIRRDRDRTLLEMTLKEGRNRQVRRMFAAVGRRVRSLERVSMGPLRLKGLRRGGWRELSAPEVRALRQAAAGRSSEPRASRASDVPMSRRARAAQQGQRPRGGRA